MSGLEKFQKSETWRSNLKKFLLMERKPEIVQNTTITESNRYSLDISDDLKNIIEQKKNQKTVQFQSKEDIINITNSTAEMEEKENMNQYDESACGETPMWQKTSDSSFETLEEMCDKTVSDPNKVLAWQKTSDESFEAMERMCDKTASDPNSTLFKYLHTDCREEILAEVKKRSTDGINKNIEILEEQLLSKINNCTLLEDIEAPSRIWENTICSDNMLQTSPVKMVGLLRPSTIIEEAPDESATSDISSHLSFHTATKAGHSSDISSSVYDTAHDSTGASNKTNFPHKFRNENLKRELLIDLDQQEAKNCSSSDILENTIVDPKSFSDKSAEKNDFKDNNTSVDLIDLEQTLGSKHSAAQSCRLLEESLSSGNDDEEKIIESSGNEQNSYVSDDDSVIEIVSDDEEDDNVEIMTGVCDSKIKTDISDINNITYSFNESNEDKENSVDNHAQHDKSMQFNDTMEEVEYMMKKGMEYMIAEAATKKSNEEINIPEPHNNIKKSQTNTPVKHLGTAKPTAYFSPSIAKSPAFTTPASKTPKTSAPSSSSKRFDIDIRPFPKLDIFAKPLDKTRAKELANKQKFSHIISPIGTYMKKTAQTPLMSSINCREKDYFNSTAIMELENESRLYKPQFDTNFHGNDTESPQKLPGLTGEAKRPLPKKAYISSDLKHIVDERTPITIPASKKIQKYLENAMMPAVLRHEGKLKVPGISNKLNTTASSTGAISKLPLKTSDTNSKTTKTTQIPRRNNASLADLSVMSGDVSMYTIMDAQKF